MIDSHTHVTSCAGDPDDVIGRARAAGVDGIVTIGSSREEMTAATALAERHPDVFATAGVHPHHAAEWDDELADLVERTAAHPRVVAVGETGLDYFRDRAPRDVQLRAFRDQIAIARRTGLPLVVHCRDADEDCFRVLVEEAPPTVVLHCFSSPARREEAVSYGWYCSFAGNVTYRSAAALQDAARLVPDERLLLETDAPYLAPVPHRGRPNEPALVVETLRAVAELRGVAPGELDELVSANAVRAFALDRVPGPGATSGA